MKNQRQNNKNIVRYRRRRQIPISTILFLLILLYLLIVSVIYWTKDRVQIYEVTSGEVMSGTTATGLIMREELIIPSQSAGYLNYYVREGHKAKVGSTVCSIDEKGDFTEKLQEAMSESSGLNSEQLGALKNKLYLFASGFEDSQFSDVYQMKYDLDLELIEDVYEVIQDSVNEQLDSNLFVRMQTDVSGLVSFHFDGMENLSETMLTKDTVNPASYQATAHRAGELVDAGENVYKIIPDDHWSLVFRLTDDQVAHYNELSRMTIIVEKSGVKLSAPFSVIAGADGTLFGKLTFSKYGASYATDRYLTFEIVENSAQKGLKIPKSAVTEEEFYTIPKNYITTAGDGNSRGFMVERAATGEIEFVIPTFYGSDDASYFVGMRDFNPGDRIRRDESDESYTVNATATLEGVFQINQGYALFRRVEIIGETGDLYLVKKGLDNSIAKFDHIVQKSAKMEEFTVIY